MNPYERFQPSGNVEVRDITYEDYGMRLHCRLCWGECLGPTPAQHTVSDGGMTITLQTLDYDICACHTKASNITDIRCAWVSAASLDQVAKHRPISKQDALDEVNKYYVAVIQPLVKRTM